MVSSSRALMIQVDGLESIREKLPANLYSWRLPEGPDINEAEEKVWEDLLVVFRDAGFAPWPYDHFSILRSSTNPVPNGFGYVTPSRGWGESEVGSLIGLRQFQYNNPLSRAARLPNGQDVVIRVITMGSEGQEHLRILRNVATGAHALFSNNHVLPMLSEVQFDDITFGIFPLVGGSMVLSWDHWAKNSVGDVMDMLLQMLEALVTIHSLKIAHRDAFHDNFLVEWQPESLLYQKPAISRPRVYLIDFEVAIQFPPECPTNECLCTGYPSGGTVPTKLEIYSRPRAPECGMQKPYDPFKLDIWQLGMSFWNFRANIPAIDEILSEMRQSDPVQRPNASSALERLSSIINSMPPTALLVEPTVISTY